MAPLIFVRISLFLISTSKIETGQVDRLVEIFRPAGQAGRKSHLSTNQNMHIYFIMNETFQKKQYQQNSPFKNTS